MSVKFKRVRFSIVPSSSPSRYEIREDVEETWRVIDTMSGLPAATNARDLVQLGRRVAVDRAWDLNKSEDQGRDSPLL